MKPRPGRASPTSSPARTVQRGQGVCGADVAPHIPINPRHLHTGATDTEFPCVRASEHRDWSAPKVRAQTIRDGYAPSARRSSGINQGKQLEGRPSPSGRGSGWMPPLSRLTRPTPPPPIHSHPEDLGDHRQQPLVRLSYACKKEHKRPVGWSRLAAPFPSYPSSRPEPRRLLTSPDQNQDWRQPEGKPGMREPGTTTGDKNRPPRLLHSHCFPHRLDSEPNRPANQRTDQHNPVNSLEAPVITRPARNAVIITCYYSSLVVQE
jgi:hypothetical protein